MVCFKFYKDYFGSSVLMERLGLRGEMELLGSWLRYLVNKCGVWDYGRNGG